MSTGKTLILGLGNDLIADDGFGPAVAAACGELFADRPEVSVETAPVSGFPLLELLAGCERALLVDVVRTGEHAPGTVLRWPLEEDESAFGARRSHGLDVPTTLALGRMLGWPMPASVQLLVAEGLDLETIHPQLTPEVAAAVPRAVEEVRRWVEEEAPEPVPNV